MALGIVGIGPGPGAIKGQIAIGVIGKGRACHRAILVEVVGGVGFGPRREARRLISQYLKLICLEIKFGHWSRYL